MAREPEILGRRMKEGIGAWRPFAQMKDDKSRLLYFLIAVNTIHEKAIEAPFHEWPKKWDLLEYTGADCGKAAVDWVLVGAAEMTDEGLLLTCPYLGTSKVRRATGKWIDDEMREAIYERDGRYCRYCGTHERDLGERLALDHVIPRSRGGTDDPENLVPACRSCNSRKGAKTPEEAGMPLIKAGLRDGETFRTVSGPGWGPDGWEPAVVLTLTDDGWHRQEGTEDG